ncbi:hypothetical protein R6Q57_011159 [Mikania cordata]
MDIKEPGRTFYSCHENVSNSGFMRCFDPYMCPRSVEIIPGLLRSKSEAKRKTFGSVQQCRRLKEIFSYKMAFFVFVIMFRLIV